MECKKCGAELPFNTYGDIKCQFCNAQNNVPLPGETDEVAEKVGGKKKSVKKEEQWWKKLIIKLFFR